MFQCHIVACEWISVEFEKWSKNIINSIKCVDIYKKADERNKGNETVYNVYEGDQQVISG